MATTSSSPSKTKSSRPTKYVKKELPGKFSALAQARVIAADKYEYSKVAKRFNMRVLTPARFLSHGWNKTRLRGFVTGPQTLQTWIPSKRSGRKSTENWLNVVSHSRFRRSSKWSKRSGVTIPCPRWIITSWASWASAKLVSRIVEECHTKFRVPPWIFAVVLVGAPHGVRGISRRHAMWSTPPIFFFY